jgi:thymidylate synthase ThyX
MPETKLPSAHPSRSESSQSEGSQSEPAPGDAHPQAETDVYAVYGVEPEVQAYAMAKYSRSALSMRESLREISEQKAERFLNTFYFQYGHRSIADLAHIAFAIEKLSLLAAIVLEDEQRWDGQERSTRYQDFRQKNYFIPMFADAEGREQYVKAIDFLFDEYQALSDAMVQHLVARTPKPAEMKQEQYERTLRARAFDIARYLLPLATNTSLGQIVNARTLENQISRLLACEFPEVRTLGEKLKEAAKSPAYNVSHERLRDLYEAICVRDEALGEMAKSMMMREVRPAPTLVKYAEPSAYEMQTRDELRQAVHELMRDEEMEPAPLVDLLEDEALEVEVATSLLYEHCHYSYRQIRRLVEGLSASERGEIITLGMKYRGKHDEVAKPFSAGQGFRFDILMDIGGFRDMHRHRRCVQLHQRFTTAHGYDTPEDVVAGGWQSRYHAAMRSGAEAAAALDGQVGPYAIPLAYRKRTLFKMDFAEAVYISELRSGPAGHFSYRRVAWEMYRAVAARYPALAKYFRVHDVNAPVDLLQR